jgi:hypothetical protein
MSDKPKTIQEALAEVQRKVNEERAAKTKAEWEAVEEGTALVPYNAVKQNDWRTVSNAPKVAKAAPVASTSGISKVASGLGRFAGPIATGASIGATASELLGAASRTETGRNVGRWIRDNVPGAPAAAEAMKKAGEAIGVREPRQTKPAETPKPTELPKIDVPAKQTTPAPKPAAPKEKTPSSFGAAFKAAREKATEMGKPSTGQFEYKGKQYQTNIQGKGTPKAPEEKYVAPSKQTKVDTSSTTATKPVATPTPKPETPKVETKPETTSTAPKAPEALGKTIGSALRGDLGRAGEGAKEWSSAVVTSLDRVRKNTADALDPKGANPEYESGNPKKGKNKMSEESNPLIAAFLKLQSENSQNMFEAAKKAKKDHDGDGKIESEKDEVWGSRFAAAKRAGKMEEANIDPVITGSSSVTKSKTGYVDPSTPKVPYSELPKPGNAAGDVLSKAKNALDKTGVREEDESLFSETELEHFKSVFNEASVAPNRPEVAAEARPDSVKDGVSANSGDTATESGKKKIKEESDAADETNMAKTQLKAMSSKAMNLHSKLKTSKNLPAWVQSKLAVAKDGVTAVDDYMTHSDKIKEETLEEGRPRKNPVASEEESPVKNIAAQVRTARSVTNDGGKSYHIPLKHPVSGKVHHVPQKAVDDFNKSYAAARKADEKEAVETAFKAKHMS